MIVKYEFVAHIRLSYMCFKQTKTLRQKKEKEKLSLFPFENTFSDQITWSLNWNLTD